MDSLWKKNMSDTEFMEPLSAKMLRPSKNTRCRSCFLEDKVMSNISNRNINQLLLEAANVMVPESEKLWQWLCWECETFLWKFVKFRRKLIRRHDILQEYLETGEPLPSQVIDEELVEQSSPILFRTEMLRINCTGFDISKEEDKFDYYYTKPIKLKPDTNQKEMIKDEFTYLYGSDFSPDLKNDLEIDDDNLISDIPLKTILKDEIIDFDATDYNEDTLEMGLVKINKNPSNSSMFERLLKKSRKEEKRKRKIAETEKNHTKSQKRKLIELDSSKIATITLSEQEQLQARKDKAASENYLHFPFRCSLCVRGFNFKQKLNNHMMVHDKNRGPYKCNICHIRLGSAGAHSYHKRSHSIRYQCLVCGRTSSEKYKMVQHYTTIHEGRVTQHTCQYCGKVFRKSRAHFIHERNHELGERHECDMCGKYYNNKESLSHHLLMHTASKEFGCDKCSKRFVTLSDAKVHQLKHQVARHFYCAECDASFKTERNLKYHMLTAAKHVDQQRLRYKCEQCDKRYQIQSALRNHVLSAHIGEKRFPCALCPSRFVTANGLSKHRLKVHEGISPPLNYICESCGKAFRTRNSLQNHIRTHTGERPFSCTQCDSAFTQLTGLRTHVKIVHLKLKRNVTAKTDVVKNVSIGMKKQPIL